MTEKLLSPYAARKRAKYAHPLVAQTAHEMAGSLFEDLMQDNTAYKDWKAQCPDLTPEELEARFIALTAPRLLEQARATLAKLLATSMNEDLKELIYDALVLDNTIMGRSKGQGLRLN